MDYEYDDYGMHEPELIHSTMYCENCDETHTFYEESYPGGRTHSNILCPSCEKVIGVGEEDARLVETVKGRVANGREVGMRPPPL